MASTELLEDATAYAKQVAMQASCRKHHMAKLRGRATVGRDTGSGKTLRMIIQRRRQRLERIRHDLHVAIHEESNPCRRRMLMNVYIQRVSLVSQRNKPDADQNPLWP